MSRTSNLFRSGGSACWSAYETQEECDADETGAQAPCITRREVESSGLDDEDCSDEDRDAAAHAPGARYTVEIDE